MPGNISNIVIISLFIVIGALATVSIIVRTIRNRCASTKTVKAVIIDKHKVEKFSKYSGTGTHERYVIVFSIDGKKKSFYVSQFSYNSYRINEKGTLKYKGDKLIEFKINPRG